MACKNNKEKRYCGRFQTMENCSGCNFIVTGAIVSPIEYFPDENNMIKYGKKILSQKSDFMAKN